MKRPLILALAGVLAISPALQAAKPNILFLFADDYCHEAVRAFGLTDIDTPNLDRLAARGTTFTRACNMGSWSGAVCVASRTMLVTGRSLWDARNVFHETDAERKKGVLWPQLMKQAGYKTYMTGKWHVETAAESCFDVVKDVRGGMPGTVPSAYNRPIEGEVDAWSPFDKSLGGFWEGGTHWSEVVRDHTLRFLADAKQQEKPFFIYAAFNAPHDPRQAPEEFVARYPLSRVAVPLDFLPEYPYKDAIGCSHKLRDENLAPMPRTELAVKRHRQEYYALISHLDAQIGRILDALDASGQAADTWIFFTADHGLAVGHHGLWGKQNLYDHSVRVPFLVAGPGVPGGVRKESAIYLQDVMATALELAGAEKPEHVFFSSLLPVLEGRQEGASHGAMYGAYLELQRSITDDGWKLIAYPKARVLRLYHLDQDPLERIDLASDPAHELKKKDLLERLRQLSAGFGDPLDLSKHFAL
jgi:choline-sulfatase